MRLGRYKREGAALSALVLLLVIVAIVAPSFFAWENLRDVALNNAAALLVAVGMTVVVLVGEIDISVGSLFGVCGVAAGWLAKDGVPVPLLLPCVLVIGAAMGAINGLLVGKLRLPSIIVTLATLVAWRDALRWATQGAWIEGLPRNFQWFGLGEGPAQGVILGVAVGVVALGAWILHDVAIGRAVHAVGSDREAARLAGIEPDRIVVGAFVVAGALVGLAALLNAARFSAVPSNAGEGMELGAIAAVVVGGTAITGGRGTLLGTLIGVALLGSIRTALTFVGINPFWEQAIQGAIILAALVSESVLRRVERRATLRAVARVGA